MQTVRDLPPRLVAAALLLLGAAHAGAQAPVLPVAVAARDLPRGTVLAAADLAPAPGAAAPVGWVTRRLVRQGEPLRPPAIAPADAVRAGRPVRLVWRDGDVALALAGTALGAAREGEPVRVRVDAHRQFTGIVVDSATVRLDPAARP